MFVGIDLGWTSGRTGLAVVDEDGRLLDSTSVTTDEEIVTWVEALEGPIVAGAVDAPLVVGNPTGQRTAEREIGRAFGRYGASAHTSNLAKPGMNPPRAAVLAARLGWTTSPRQGTPEEPACIEVYPHAALVALFELPERLAYKRKFGVEQRKRAFDQLIEHLETVPSLDLSYSARWHNLVMAVHNASRQVELNTLEDEFDAIVCAHVAWLWQIRPDALHVYGNADADYAEGYIVAPPAPTHVPATTPTPQPRPVRLTLEVGPEYADAVRAAVARIEGVLSVR